MFYKTGCRVTPAFEVEAIWGAANRSKHGCGDLVTAIEKVPAVLLNGPEFSGTQTYGHNNKRNEAIIQNWII